MAETHVQELTQTVIGLQEEMITIRQSVVMLQEVCCITFISGGGSRILEQFARVGVGSVRSGRKLCLFPEKFLKLHTEIMHFCAKILLRYKMLFVHSPLPPLNLSMLSRP